MMFTYKIETTVDSKWNQNLLKSTHANFFHSVEYLDSISKEFFPLYVSILDENENVVAQLKIIIILSSVLYSNPLFDLFFKLIQKLSRRGIWRDGPIIHSNNKEERIKILQTIIKANDEIFKKYDLMLLEGYISPYDRMVDNDYIQQFLNHGYTSSPLVTYIIDTLKPIEEIWKNVARKARGDVNRAKRRNLIVKKVNTFDELKEYMILHNNWTKTKGLELSDPFRDIEKLWKNYKTGLEQFFLAYKDGKLISAVRLVCFNAIAYANFVVSSNSESTNLGGSYLTWYTIEWAKDNGFKLYDLSGGKKSSDKNDKNLLLFYKKKWGGNEHFHYNLVKIQKRYHYEIFKLLFNLFRRYNNFQGRKNKKITTKHDYEQ
jgi:lipid II:glycine glycyltransferase (peptidoglycan interpeptide bridge formation enzyme)